MRAAAQLIDLLLGRLQLSAHDVCPAQEGLSDRCKAHSLGGALEQGNAKLFFQLLDAARNHRLGLAEVARCGPQPASFGHRDEVSDGAKFHGDAFGGCDPDLLSMG